LPHLPGAAANTAPWNTIEKIEIAAHLSRSRGLVSGTAYMIPRHRPAVNAKTAATSRGFCNKKRGEEKMKKKK
jgi:hypothetical protein